MCNTFLGKSEFGSIALDTVFHDQGKVWIKCLPERAAILTESGPSYFINAYTVVALDVTPAMLADTIKQGAFSAQTVSLMYQCRNLMIERFLQGPLIAAADVARLDRTGRCRIASEHWSHCAIDARRALLNDAHHFVRACAELSSVGFVSTGSFE